MIIYHRKHLAGLERNHLTVDKSQSFLNTWLELIQST